MSESSAHSPQATGHSISSSLGPVVPPSQPDPTGHPSQVTGHYTSTPVDVYFLLDRSGSMEGDNWNGACKALASFVPRLHPDARVWLTLFESGVKDYDSAPVRAGDLDFGRDGAKIRRHGTAGGTELIPAIEHIGKKIAIHTEDRAAVVLLITDGEIGNEYGAVKVAATLGCPVHIVGVAMTANDGLDAVARETGGRCVFLAPGEDIAAAVERFAPVLRPPVLTGLAMPSGWATADGAPLRDLCDGDDIVIPISAIPDASGFNLTCASAVPQLSTLNPQLIRSREAGLLWARARIRHLDASKRGMDALAVAKEFNLLSRNAAFIAWDEAEKVSVAQTEIIQPALEPSKGTRMLQMACADYSEHSSVMDFAEAPRSLRVSRSGRRKARGKMAPPPAPDIPAICKELLATIEMLRQELPRVFHPQPLPGRLMDAIRQLHDFALAESNEPDAGEIALLLIEQLRQELDQAFREHRERLLGELARINHQIARLDELRAGTKRLAGLQNSFRSLGV